MPTANNQPTVGAETQTPDFKSITGQTKYNDNTSALKTKVNNTKVTKQDPCPKSDSFLQFEGGTSKGMEVSGDGFSLKEYNPPKLSKTAGANGGPAVGSPTTPTPYRDIRCGNLLDKNIDFKCSVVSTIKLDSCLFQFEATIQAYIERQMKLAWSYLLQMFPGNLDYLTKISKLICSIANEIQRIMCLIQQIMECILSTVQFITQLVNWALSLPMQFLSQLMSCITNFVNQIVGGLGDLTGALGMILTNIFGCEPFQCTAVSSVYDIGDTASGIGSDFSKVNL